MWRSKGIALRSQRTHVNENNASCIDGKRERIKMAGKKGIGLVRVKGKKRRCKRPWEISWKSLVVAAITLCNSRFRLLHGNASGFWQVKRKNIIFDG